jgi:hypothetical protein
MLFIDKSAYGRDEHAKQGGERQNIPDAGVAPGLAEQNNGLIDELVQERDRRALP